MTRIEQWRDVLRRVTGRGTYPHQFAFLLLLPFRGLILSPKVLVQRLCPKQTSRVLEVGPGPGYFSIHVARSVPSGHLCLVDIQREMLQKARRRIRRAGIKNTSFVQASATELPFRPETFDVAFMVTVLGEVPDPRASVHSIAGLLRANGVLSITELPGDPDAMSESEVAALALSEGFERAERFPTRGGFTANFRKP